MSLQPLKPKYGTSEQKKTELDALTLQVIAAQHVVERDEAIVSSLTQKSALLQGFLSLAQTNLVQAHKNKALVAELAVHVSGLKNTSEIALSGIDRAADESSALSLAMKQVIDKLIYSASAMNKLANEVIKQKVLNPLISDDLVSMVGTACKDANNAVALTLVALQSAFAAQASNQKSAAAISLEDQQVKNLYDIIITLKDVLDEVSRDAAYQYQLEETSVKATEKQLTHAQAELNKAQIKLRSLQSSLAAANAAALAG